MREVEDAGSVVIFVSGRFMAPLRVRADGDVLRDVCDFLVIGVLRGEG